MDHEPLASFFLRGQLINDFFMLTL